MTANEDLRRRRNWRSLVASAIGERGRTARPGPLVSALMSWRTAFQVVHRRPPVLADYPPAVRDYLAMLGSITPRRGPRGYAAAQALAARRAWDDEMLTRRYQALRDLYRFAGREKWATFSEFSRQSFLGDRPSELALAQLANEAGIEPETLRPRVQRRRHA